MHAIQTMTEIASAKRIRTWKIPVGHSHWRKQNQNQNAFHSKVILSPINLLEWYYVRNILSLKLSCLTGYLTFNKRLYYYFFSHSKYHLCRAINVRKSNLEIEMRLNVFGHATLSFHIGFNWQAICQLKQRHWTYNGESI